MKHPNERFYNLWFVIRPAKDVRGQWVAHCLDLDVVTQGNSLRHALEMAHEAAQSTILDDLNAGEDPLDRRAPREFWDEMWKQLMPKSQVRTDLPRLLENDAKVACLIVQMTMGFVREQPDESPRATGTETPLAFSEPANAPC